MKRSKSSPLEVNLRSEGVFFLSSNFRILKIDPESFEFLTLFSLHNVSAIDYLDAFLE